MPANLFVSVFEADFKFAPYQNVTSVSAYSSSGFRKFASVLPVMWLKSVGDERQNVVAITPGGFDDSSKNLKFIFYS